MCAPVTPMSRWSTDRISSPPDFLRVSSATSYSLRTSGGIASTLSYSWPLKTIFRLTAQGMTRRRSEARGARSTGAAARVAGSPPRPARAGVRPPPRGNRSAPANTPRTASWYGRGTRGRSLRGTPCPDPAVRSRTPRAGAPLATRYGWRPRRTPSGPGRRGLQQILHAQRRGTDAVLEAGRCAERRVRTPQSARGHRGQERRPPHAMDGVPGERHPGLGAEAYQRPGLTTELRRIGPTRRSGLKSKPRDRDDAGFDAELSDVPIEHARGSDEPASDSAQRRFHAGADTKGPDCADDWTERALDAEAGVDPVLDEGHERRDGQRALRTCGRGAAQDRGGYDHPRGPHGPGPSPAAGDTSNTVAAIRSALRPRTLAFAESRSARRRAFATMFCGIAPCRRPRRNATTPVTVAVAATTTAPSRSPLPRSPLAAPAISSAAAATPSPLATSRRAASGEIRSGRSAPRSRSRSGSSSGATSCRRSKYTRAESDVPVSRLRPTTASA